MSEDLIRRRDLPDAELAVLKCLWHRGDASVRDIRDELYPGGGSSEHATVQKLLDRLAQRGCADRRRNGRAHIWFATIERHELIDDRLRAAADRLCEGALAPLLTHLVHGGRLSKREIAELRELIDRFEETSP